MSSCDTLLLFFQTTYPYRSPSKDSGVESVVEARDHSGSGAPRHPSDYVNTSRLPSGLSSLADRTPPPPPRQWRRVTEADLFRPIQDQPVGGDQEEEEAGSGAPEDTSGGNLIDLDGTPEDDEPGDDFEESSGDQGKEIHTSTMVPIFEVTQPSKVTVTQAPGSTERKGVLVEGEWSPEARGSVPRPTVPFDVYIETRHTEGVGDTRFYWMPGCASQSVTTRQLTREDYFCLVGSLNPFFHYFSLLLL